MGGFDKDQIDVVLVHGYRMHALTARRNVLTLAAETLLHTAHCTGRCNAWHINDDVCCTQITVGMLHCFEKTGINSS